MKGSIVVVGLTSAVLVNLWEPVASIKILLLGPALWIEHWSFSLSSYTDGMTTVAGESIGSGMILRILSLSLIELG